MEMTKVIMGVPRNITNLTGMEFVPYKNSRILMCVVCDAQCWVGPEQGKVHDAHGYPILCAQCVATAMHQSGMTEADSENWMDDHMQVLTNKQMGD